MRGSFALRGLAIRRYDQLAPNSLEVPGRVMISGCSLFPKRIDAEPHQTAQDPAHRAADRPSRNLSLRDQVQNDEDDRAKDGASHGNGIASAVLLFTWKLWGLVAHVSR